MYTNAVRCPRCTSKHIFLMLMAIVSLLLTVSALAQGTYTQIDGPGGGTTMSLGINSIGEVTGYYYTVQGGSYALGYVLSNGSFTTINYGPNTSTLLRALNDKGQIVGNTSNGVAFIFDRDEQTFTVLPCYFSPTGINNSGVVVGTSDYMGVGVEGSTCIYQLAKYSSQTDPEGITANGTVVGFAESSITGNFGSFAYQSGQFRQVSMPYPSLHLEIYGVSPSGNAVVATSVDSSSSFLVEQGEAVQMLTFPGANFTWATGVNDSGEVVGSFLDSHNLWHGFTWTPPVVGK